MYQRSYGSVSPAVHDAERRKVTEQLRRALDDEREKERLKKLGQKPRSGRPKGVVAVSERLYSTSGVHSNCGDHNTTSVNKGKDSAIKQRKTGKKDVADSPSRPIKSRPKTSTAGERILTVGGLVRSDHSMWTRRSCPND